MDMEVEIKEEPVWLEGTPNTSHENFELVSEVIPVKQETKSELIEIAPTQEITSEPPADIKEETFIEQHPVDQLVPYIKEEKNVENVAVLTMHTEERIHHCKECKFTFAQRTSLQVHMLSHNRERPFRCEDCNSTFKLRNSLHKHMVIHTADRAYNCKGCNKAFVRQCDLRRHSLVHTAERPFRCQECHSTFTQRGSLQSHMIVHTGERPHQCKECKKTFVRRSYLRRHMLIHTVVI